MNNFAHFSTHLFPFLGGISADYLAEKLSPEEYYHDYARKSFNLSLICATGSILSNLAFIYEDYQKITLPMVILGSFITSGYVYNLHRLNYNISDEVCIKETQRIIDECHQNNYKIGILGDNPYADSDITNQSDV